MSVFGGNDSENQKDYTWEIRDTEDANEWLENIEMDGMFHFNEIKNSKGKVYQILDEGRVVCGSLCRDLNCLMYNISNLVIEFKTENACDTAYRNGTSNEELEKEIQKITDKYTNYKVIAEKQPDLKSNRIIKDLDSANQWIVDLGYEGAIRFNNDGGKFWTIEVMISNEWRQYKKVEGCQEALEEVSSIIVSNVKIPKVAVDIDKLEVTPEKELRVIRSIKDANDWLKSIGRDGEYTIGYAKGIKEVGTGIKCTRKDGSIAHFTKEIEKVVDKIAKEIQGAKPLCKNTIYDITTLNLWLDTIDKNNGGRRPYIFKKRTEHGNVYSVWDIYKEKGSIETKLEFINTSLQISLGYIVVTRKLKNYLWDVQLKKESVKKGLDITINNLESANKWLASLGYGNYIKFNCKSHVQNTPKGKIRYPAYFIQERLSGDNWKIVNNTYGKFNDILNLFCKLANITEIPKCTIVFTPQLVEEQKASEIIQSVKGANLWFEKINIQGCKFRIKSREDKQNKRLYTIEFMNPQGQIGKFYECTSLKESIDYFCKCYQIKAPAVAKNM